MISVELLWLLSLAVVITGFVASYITRHRKPMMFAFLTLALGAMGYTIFYSYLIFNPATTPQGLEAARGLSRWMVLINLLALLNASLIAIVNFRHGP